MILERGSLYNLKFEGTKNPLKSTINCNVKMSKDIEQDSAKPNKVAIVVVICVTVITVLAFVICFAFYFIQRSSKLQQTL